ncbi:hypothetical protein GXM_09432 [Nostoc sphaeroides CCNUC1]|uniref:Uncharacterized protein n=1 Tax=Nostoc sphaeroides CCNUC1 TaxID=2653204 RepID=A0A5P8WGN4_9NOSO|nr:hypothetical protein GXM_09432 [Nostoc sphaeroides CCNUC1]
MVNCGNLKEKNKGGNFRTGVKGLPQYQGVSGTAKQLSAQRLKGIDRRQL